MNLGVLKLDTRLILPGMWPWIASGVVTGVIGLGLTVGLYWLTGQTIDGLVAGTNPLAEWWYWFVLLVVGRAAGTWYFRISQFRASETVKLAIRDRMYQHALRLGPTFLTGKRTGEIVNVAVSGMERIEQLYGIYLIQFATAILTPVVLCVALLAIDPLAALAMLVTIPLMPLFLGRMAAGFRRSSRRSASAGNRLMAQFLDSLQGMTTLKMFNRSQAMGEAMAAESESNRLATMQLLRVSQIGILVTDVGFGLGITLVMTSVVVVQLSLGAITPGLAVALVLISTEFWKPLNFINSFFFIGGIGREIAGRITAFLDETAPVADPPHPVTPPRLAIPRLTTAGLHFSYPGADRPAVDSVDLTIAPGEMVALVGHSGSGKTTLTNLLMRFLEPDAGSIQLDGVDVSTVTGDWVRDHVTLVPQDPYLFYGTIGDNLRVARPAASDDELWAAVEAANLRTTIEAMPLGFETPVGERGTSLSGGQVQRLAIARALLRQAPIVVLDEPTSQIDRETEAVIQDALDGLRGSRSVLIVAHRLQTARRADRIVVMADGRVIEQGTPQELEAAGGTWARMMAVSDAHEARLSQLVGGSA